MADYITWKDVVDRYPNAAKDVSGSEGVKNNFVNGAEAHVNARLAQRYSIPFTPCPQMIKDVVIDLAYFKMIGVRQKDSKTFKSFLDERLDGLADGTLTLMTDSGTQYGANETVFATDQYGTAFGVDDPTLWRVSSAWQTQLESDRGQL